MNITKIIQHIIPLSLNGYRVDQTVSKLLSPEFSRNKIKQLIKNGQLLLCGCQVFHPATRIKSNQIITIPPPKIKALEILPEPLKLAVLYEDEHLIVVNKPPGIVVHPATGHLTGTLVHRLLHHCGNLSSIGGKYRPGIIHRLDKNTSGALIAAKSNMAHQNLAAAFASGRVVKEYLTLVWGFPPKNNIITNAIGRHPTNRKRMSSINSRNTKTAISHWEVINYFTLGLSLLQVRIYTGRTHQIRVHLSEAGWPIVGDTVYGNQQTKNNIHKKLNRIVKTNKRQLLHAAYITFKHPIKKNKVEINAPLPLDFRTILERLEKNQK